MAGFILVEDGGWFAEVDFGAEVVAVEERLGVEHLADGDGVVCGVEGTDEAAEGGEGREGVEGGDRGDFGAYGAERGRLEEVQVVEVGDEEGVGWRRGLGERREVAEVEREVWARGVGGGSRGTTRAEERECLDHLFS